MSKSIVENGLFYVLFSRFVNFRWSYGQSEFCYDLLLEDRLKAIQERVNGHDFSDN